MNFRRAGLAAGVLALLALAWIPSSLHEVPGMGSRPALAAGVAALMALWWLTDALPMGVTACAPLILFPALSVLGDSVVENVAGAAAPFLDAYIFMFMGGMTLGAAMEETGLHERVALHIMKRVGTRPAQLLLGVLLATALVSMWISNTATAVMMLPIALALVKQMEAQHGGGRLWNFGGAVMLAVAYGANVGGMGTKIGTGTNSIFCGFAARVLHRDIGFLEFMAVAMPFVVLLLPGIAWVLWQTAKKDQLPTLEASGIIERRIKSLGKWKGDELRVALVFGGAATLWVLGDVLKDVVAPWVPEFWTGYRFQGKHYEATVALLAAAAVLILRCVSLRMLRKVPWDTLLLLGGSFAMAAGLEGSGFSGVLANHLKALVHLPPLVQLILAASATVFLSAVASNTATINVMLNVLPKSLPMLFVCTMAASCDFMLPAGTPPNAIVFGSGYVRLPVMIRTGFALDILAALLVALYGYVYVPLILGNL